MTDIEQMQAYVLRKTHNVISLQKAEQLLERAIREYPGLSAAERMDALEAFPLGPAWLRAIVAINESFFFRHPEQFEMLKAWAIQQKQESINVLCAAAAHGQEAYSIGIVLSEALGQRARFQILALDIDEGAIEIAKAGRYSETEFQRAPEKSRELLGKYFQSELTPDGRVHIVDPVLRNSINFVCGNIFQAPLARYDVIFARNILIYFKASDRERIFRKLRDSLRPGGLLFVGAGEILPAAPSGEILTAGVLERKAS